MKRNWKNKMGRWKLFPVLIVIAALAALLFSCQPQEKRAAGKYTCSMHPQVVQEGPGTCPVCHMDLVPLQTLGDSSAVSGELEYLLEPVNSSIIADIRTLSPVKKQMPVEMQASGTIVYDTRNTYSIPVRFSGRVEKLYINYNFQPVRKGQKLLEIYSPEIVTAQRELTYLLESDPDNGSLIEAARQKLRLLGLTGAQIRQLSESRRESYSLPVYSPYNGYIYEETATGPSTAEPSSAPLSIREGMYLDKGQTVFKVIDASRVWAEFNIEPQAVPFIKKGDPVSIIPDFNKDMRLEAEVDFLQPFYREGENFSKVRVYLDNASGRFLPGQLVTSHFSAHSDTAWWIPGTAILDLGNKKVVFLKKGKVFQPRIVQTGRISGNEVEILSGLSAADTIAIDGHYMVDSEGFVKIRNHE